MKKFPNFLQLESWDCGPTSLLIIAKHYGINVSIEHIRTLIDFERMGTNLKSIENAADKIGLISTSVRLTLDELINQAPLPVICHWEQNHFLVVYRIEKNKIYISDPAKGKYTVSKKEFLAKWITKDEDGDLTGITMLFEPGEHSYERQVDTKSTSGFNLFKFFISSILKEKNGLFTLSIGLFIGSLIQVFLPIITQSIVDQGVLFGDKNLVTVLIIAQLSFIVIGFFIEIIRGYILLFLSMKLNLKLMSSYLKKLMQIHVSFIQKRNKGDILTRINDSDRIERFITTHLIDSLFDILTLTVLSVLLCIYDFNIFLVFLFGSIFYVTWVYLLLGKRAILDAEYFKLKGRSQNLELQIVTNIEDIKINGSTKRRLNEWLDNQINTIKTRTNFLKLQNKQEHFAELFRTSVNIVIILISALAVINGNMTLGSMLAIQFILSQTSLPLNRFVHFMLELQDAKLSIKRLNEVFNEQSENDNKELLGEHNTRSSIRIDNMSFSYLSSSKPLFSDFNMEIERGKVTAIVGPSGSGKTTLFNLLLAFREPNSGNITIGETNLKHINPSSWRDKCGVVLQNGKLFNDTLERNITEGASEKATNSKWLSKVVEICCLVDVIKELPNGLKTKLGEQGALLSGGEKQKVLLARAVYKKPEYLLMDEATSAMDSNNEKQIQINLERFFKGRTVVIIAHRLSTVINADKIVVLSKGKVIQTGKHTELIKCEGPYSKLVKNQLAHA